MLLTQLQTPALRSVARASPASWSAARWLHGSSCTQRRLFDQLFPAPSKPPSPPQSSLPDSPTTSPAPARPPPRWASPISDELPPLAPSEELLRLSELPEPDDDDATFLDSAAPDVQRSSEAAALRATTMLILNAASKQLTESDFMRIGARGKHIPTWVTGIVKIIQGRDHDTLEPMGHYFILFDRYEAAVAYSEEVQRLRQLSKEYTPGASHALRHEQRRHSLPVGLPTDTGEDVASLVRSFTLVPPSQRPRLQISKLSQGRISKLDRGGALIDDIISAVGGFRHLVMLHVAEGGRMSLDMVRHAIRNDGIERNLPWRVVSLNTGIIPFGKGIIRPSHKVTSKGGDYSAQEGDFSRTMTPEEQEEEEGAEPLDNHDDDVAAAEEDNSHIKGSKSGAGAGDPQKVQPLNAKRQYPRFIVAFTDEAEARRFIRNWHRRELAPSSWMPPGPTAPGLYQPGKGNGSSASPQPWEDSRIINASWLW